MGSPAALRICCAILPTMSRGVPDGAMSPFQVITLKPGKPDSANVRTFGSCGAREFVDTASNRIAPDSADRKSTRLNSSHQIISYAVFCLKKKKIRSKVPRAYIFTSTLHDK